MNNVGIFVEKEKIFPKFQAQNQQFDCQLPLLPIAPDNYRDGTANFLRRHMENFSTNSLALIVSDREYSKTDYVRDFGEFKTRKKY